MLRYTNGIPVPNNAIAQVGPLRRPHVWPERLDRRKQHSQSDQFAIEEQWNVLESGERGSDAAAT